VASAMPDGGNASPQKLRDAQVNMRDRLPNTQHLDKEHEKFVSEFWRMHFQLEQISIKSIFQDMFRIDVPFHGKPANTIFTPDTFQVFLKFETLNMNDNAM
jgi:hypothetical protein